jgi:hypothetical protein
MLLSKVLSTFTLFSLITADALLNSVYNIKAQGPGLPTSNLNVEHRTYASVVKDGQALASDLGKKTAEVQQASKPENQGMRSTSL